MHRTYAISVMTQTLDYQDTPDVYSLRRDRPMYWLQRLCCWTLQKLGATQQKTYPAWHRIVITADAQDKIMALASAVMSCTQTPISTIYMGMDEFSSLTNHSSYAKVIDSMPGGLRFRDRAHGWDIVVLPYMQGILPVSECQY